MIIFELDLDFKYPSTKQLNFIDELESIGIKLKSVSSATKVYFDNVEIDQSKTITIENPVSGTHYFKNDLGTQIKCVFIAKNSSVNFEPGKPDLSNYYTKPETDEAIAEAIEGIDFPEPEIPETSTIPQKNGMDGNFYLVWNTSNEGDPYIKDEYTAAGGDSNPQYYTVYLNKSSYSAGTYILHRTVKPLWAAMNEDTYTDYQTFNFPDTIISLGGLKSSNPLRNEIQHYGYSTVDGFVLRYDSSTDPLVVENVRGFLVLDDTLEDINRPTLIVKNCGMLGVPDPFNGVEHVIIDGDVNYFTTLMFTRSISYTDTICKHMTFIGKGILKSKIFEFDNNSASDLEYYPIESEFALTIEFPDITFNEFVDWCGANNIGLYRLYDDFFNGSAIAKLVFKDQTITDVNQTKLDNSYAKVIATLEDGTTLPLRTTGEYAGWVQLAKDATTLEVDSISGILTLNNVNIFKNYNFNSVKEFTNKVAKAYAFNYALDKESATEQAYLAPNVDIKDAYLDSCGATGTLFNENRVIQNVYFKEIPSANAVETALGTQNTDANIYFAGVLAAVYSGFYHSITWKNGFGPTAD